MSWGLSCPSNDKTQPSDPLALDLYFVFVCVFVFQFSLDLYFVFVCVFVFLFSFANHITGWGRLGDKKALPPPSLLWPLE